MLERIKYCEKIMVKKSKKDKKTKKTKKTRKNIISSLKKLIGRKVPLTYVPNKLSKTDMKKQINSLKNHTSRPKLKSFKSHRSPWVKKFMFSKNLRCRYTKRAESSETCFSKI